MGPLTVSTLAKQVGLRADTIRYYQRARLLPPPLRSPAGYRRYDQTTVDRVRFIRGAQRLGLRLREIADLLAVRGRGACPCGHEVVFDSNCSGPQGQIWFHRTTNGATLGSFQIPRVQPTEQYCSAHLFNVLKTDPDQYRLVAAWYSGGVTVVDFTQPGEVAYYDFAPLEAVDTEGLWSAYGYNGFVYSNGLFRGFDSLFIPQARAGAKQLSTLNPQTQL